MERFAVGTSEGIDCGMEIGRFLVVEPKRANSSEEPEVQLAELNGRIDQSGYKKKGKRVPQLF